MIKSYQSKILKLYETTRVKEEKALKKRRREIENTIPEVLEIEKQIAKLCIKVSISAFKDIENRLHTLEPGKSYIKP